MFATLMTLMVATANLECEKFCCISCPSTKEIAVCGATKTEDPPQEFCTKCDCISVTEDIPAWGYDWDWVHCCWAEYE